MEERNREGVEEGQSAPARLSRIPSAVAPQKTLLGVLKHECSRRGPPWVHHASRRAQSRSTEQTFHRWKYFHVIAENPRGPRGDISGKRTTRIRSNVRSAAPIFRFSKIL